MDSSQLFATPISDTLPFQFLSKEDALAFYKGIYGVNKTLCFNKEYSGATHVIYTCKHCSYFKLK